MVAGLGRDPSRIVFAVRKLGEPVVIGLVQIAAINPVHRSAEMGSGSATRSIALPTGRSGRTRAGFAAAAGYGRRLAAAAADPAR
jgi:hypothetical protein